MKRICNLLLASSILLVLSGCGNDEDKKDDEEIVIEELVISEYVEGKDSAKAIEIYNPTDNTVNLENYSIGIYKNGQTNLTYNIKLENTLESKDCYVVVYDGSPTELLEKADLVSDDLYYTGDDPIVLMQGDQIISQIGTITALSIDYGVDKTLVKLDPNSNLGNYSYVPSDWVEYNADDYSNLGTIEHKITMEELLDGPKLLDKYLEIPFFPEGTNSTNFLSQTGTGGAVEVTLRRTGDGDTTYFNYPAEWDHLNLDPEVNRFRYFGVNTPESSSNTVKEPFGKTAANYVNDLLTNAETIHIQSIEGYSVNGTYNRLMGLVWVDGELLQHKIIKMGYSKFTHASQPFTMEKIPLTSYLMYNANYAQLNGKGIWGEKDPLWDYETNQPIGW